MAAAGRVRAWKDLLSRNTIIPSNSDREKTQSDVSTPFAVSIKNVEGLLSQGSAKKTEYQVRVSLFDLTYRQFFGRTWTGPVVSAKQAANRARLVYNQNVYFHTSINDDAIAMVLEVVAISNLGEGKMQQVSSGWTFFRIFQHDGDMPDTSSSSNPKPQQLSLYHGSPRCLLQLEDPIEAKLTMIEGSTLTHAICTHRPLQKAMHLLPENVVIGTNDLVPGIADLPRQPGAADSLKKPRLLKSLTCQLERVSISLPPSIAAFEEELCQQVNNDRINKENKVADGTTVQIVKRSLQVGVHNGWCYVQEPDIVMLSVDTPTPSKRPGSFRKGHQRSHSSTSLNSAACSLIHRNRVQLEGLREDPAFTVVFSLLYELGQPMTDKARRMSLGRQSIQISVRWAAFCPLAHPGTSDHSLQLMGGAGSNPDMTFMFHSADGNANVGSSASLTALTGGTINFTFSHARKGKENDVAMMSGSQSLHVPGSQLYDSSHGMRPLSQATVYSDGSSVLAEVQQTTGRPPVHPASARGMPPQSYRQDYSPVPPLGPFSSSPPGTAHSQMYLQPSASSTYPQHGTSTGAYPSTGAYTGTGTGPGSLPTPHYSQQQMTGSPRYMPLEIQHYRDGVTPMQSSRMNQVSPDLHELAYTPVHIPIMATAPGMHSGQGLSRAAYAKLYTAGFPAILDRKGDLPYVIDNVDTTQYVAAKETTDKLLANEIVLQFLAFGKMLSFENSGSSKQPGTVFFTFQFYRFPQVNTERLVLGNVEGELSADPKSLPCLLQKLDKDGSVIKDTPGYMIKYLVDPAYMKPGEGQLFLQYLSQQNLHIDVWDGDTLHLIGSCVVDLKNLCRQGRESVQVTYELDVVNTEYIEHDGPVSSGDITRDGRVLPVNVNVNVRGRLHLRMANIGRLVDTKAAKTGLITQTAKPKTLVKQDMGGSSFLGGSLNAINSHTNVVRHTKVCKAQHVAEINQELVQVLNLRHGVDENTADTMNSGMPGGTDRKRKLNRMEMVRKQHGEQPLSATSQRKQKQERARDLKTIDLFRQQTKEDGILGMLNQAITTEHTLHTTMGVTQFFEFTLKNPYNQEHTIGVECDDPELFVITNTAEWRHYKMLNEVYTSVEEGMFNTETKSGNPEIFLRPKETVTVPFKFLSFKANHSVQPQMPSDPHKPQIKRGFANSKKSEDPLQSRIVKVFFRTGEKRPVAVLSVRVEPQPHIVDQTFRFHHPEQSFLKKSIRLPSLHNVPGVPIGGSGQGQVYVRCSDINVICESRKVPAGEPHDVFIKVACGASPQIKRFFLAVYSDPYLSRPIQLWQIYIHAMQRIDVACVEGTTSRFTLILRGTQSSRLVQCYPSHASEMSVHPTEPFMLPANTVQELHVGVRPLHTGNKFLYINVVDVEYHQLVRAWLVSVNCSAPIISRAFEILLPAGGGKGCNKRISYTNPYPHAKVFCLLTNRDDLLQFKDTRLELPGGESASIGMRFAPTMNQGSVEILVFVNDEDDKNEETFCVKAIYQ